VAEALACDAADDEATSPTESGSRRFGHSKGHCQLGEADCGWDDRRVDLGGEGLG
jgi:hypothetical protein